MQSANNKDQNAKIEQLDESAGHPRNKTKRTRTTWGNLKPHQVLPTLFTTQIPPTDGSPSKNSVFRRGRTADAAEQI